MSEQRMELCCMCDEPTGRAGAADDSLYLNDGVGPLCEKCYGVTPEARIAELDDELGRERAGRIVAEADNARLAAEVERLEAVAEERLQRYQSECQARRAAQGELELQTIMTQEAEARATAQRERADALAQVVEAIADAVKYYDCYCDPFETGSCLVCDVTAALAAAHSRQCTDTDEEENNGKL